MEGPFDEVDNLLLDDGLGDPKRQRVDGGAGDEERDLFLLEWGGDTFNVQGIDDAAPMYGNHTVSAHNFCCELTSLA